MHLEQIHSQIDNAYVDGISITLGSPCKYVWTYTVSHSDSIKLMLVKVIVHVPLFQVHPFQLLLKRIITMNLVPLEE